MPPCKNNGICFEPGTCQCPENFVGPYCEHEKKLCLTRPVQPHNSKLSCSSTSCTIACAKGHTFPDGSSITNMICKNGEWAPSRADQTFVPDCSRKIDLMFRFIAYGAHDTNIDLITFFPTS